MTEYSPDKTGKYPRIFPNFQNCTRGLEDLKDINGVKRNRVTGIFSFIFFLMVNIFLDNNRKKIEDGDGDEDEDEIYTKYKHV